MVPSSGLGTRARCPWHPPTQCWTRHKRRSRRFPPRAWRDRTSARFGQRIRVFPGRGGPRRATFPPANRAQPAVGWLLAATRRGEDMGYKPHNAARRIRRGPIHRVQESGPAPHRMDAITTNGAPGHPRTARSHGLSSLHAAEKWADNSAASILPDRRTEIRAQESAATPRVGWAAQSLREPERTLSPACRSLDGPNANVRSDPHSDTC